MSFKTLISQRSTAERNHLRHLLAYENDFRVLDDETGPTGITELVQRIQPDVLFLDAQMPDQSGLSIAEDLRPLPSPAIVLTATNCSLASRAFELGSADFILKPFEHASFKVALDRVRHRLEGERIAGGPETARRDTGGPL